MTSTGRMWWWNSSYAGQAEQGTEDGARGVRESVEAEDPAAVLGRDPGHEQRIARSAAHALAQPIDHAPGEHDGPDRRHGDQHLAERRQAVAETDERTLRPPVGDTAGDELGQAGSTLRHALDDRRPQLQARPA